MERTLSNVLECIGVYCKSNYDLQYSSQIDDGKITFHGKLFATYVWNDNASAPYFLFDRQQAFYQEYPNGRGSGHRICDDFMKAQFFKRPFVHHLKDHDHPDKIVLDHIDYVVQELKDDLIFSQALLIKLIRDKHACNWDIINSYLITDLQRTIEKSMYKSSYKQLTPQTHPGLWKHLALCCVYDI